MIQLERQICGVSVKVRTHDEAHLDEWVALWMAERFASRSWVMNHCINAELVLGIEGGEFDEHPRLGQPVKERECCATLMAKSLGIADDRTLSQMIKYVKGADVDGKGGSFALYNLVKMMNAEYSDQPERVLEWTFFALDSKHAEQMEFAASYEEAKKGKIEVVTLEGMSGPTARVLIVHSDRKKMVAAATVNPELRPDVIIQRRSNRQVMIFTVIKAGDRTSMGPVVTRLRLGEAKAASRILTSEQKRELSAPGHAAGDEIWFYNPRGEMILNGSNTAKEVPATRMDFGKILGAVCWGIRDQLRQRLPRAFKNGSVTPAATPLVTAEAEDTQPEPSN